MRDAAGHRENEKTALYQLFNAADELIYAGITHDVKKRRRQHARDKPWWPEVASEKVDWYETRSLALIAEDRMIATLWPKYNSQCRSGATVMLVHYPNDVLERIDAAARRSGLSRAAWLRQVAAAAVSVSEQRKEAGV